MRSMTERVCQVLEALAAEEEMDNFGRSRLGEAEQLPEFISRVFRFAHIARNPICLDVHTKWVEDFEELEKQLLGTRTIDSIDEGSE